MGIKFVREGNACERCKVKPTQESNKLVHFTKYEIDGLLCGNCRDKIAQLDGIEVRNYILEKFGRCEANWFDEYMSRMLLKS